MTITAREIRSEVSASLTDLETGFTDKLNTAISQTAEQIKVVANRFNEDGSIKNTAGLVTTAMANKLYAFDSNGNIVSFISQTASSIKIKAKNIALEGLVTANGNFKILTDGSIEAVNANLRGTVYAVTGKMGGFTMNPEDYTGKQEITSEVIQEVLNLESHILILTVSWMWRLMRLRKDGLVLKQ